MIAPDITAQAFGWLEGCGIPVQDVVSTSTAPRRPGGISRSLGKPIARGSGLAKATGEAVYTDDLAVPRTLRAKTLRSPHAQSRLKRIDAARALAVEKARRAQENRLLPGR